MWLFQRDFHEFIISCDSGQLYFEVNLVKFLCNFINRSSKMAYSGLATTTSADYNNYSPCTPLTTYSPNDGMPCTPCTPTPSPTKSDYSNYSFSDCSTMTTYTTQCPVLATQGQCPTTQSQCPITTSQCQYYNSQPAYTDSYYSQDYQYQQQIDETDPQIKTDPQYQNPYTPPYYQQSPNNQYSSCRFAFSNFPRYPVLTNTDLPFSGLILDFTSCFIHLLPNSLRFIEENCINSFWLLCALELVVIQFRTIILSWTLYPLNIEIVN
jgi:hypothetical protein